MLKTNYILWLLALPAIVCVLVQIGLGASMTVLFFATACMALGLYGFWMFGVGNMAGWFCLFYMSGNVLFAFYGKTILRQTVESNLYTPTVSFEVQAVCGVALLAAMILAHWINIGRPLQPITDLGTLRFISYICFTMGIGISIFHIYGDHGVGGPEYGGLAMFDSLMYLGIVFRTAYAILRSDGRRNFDSVLLLMLLIATAFGLVTTGRFWTAMPSIYFFVTILFFRGKLPWRYVAAIGCGAVIFVLIAPTLLVFRYMGFKSMTFKQEVVAFEYAVPLVLNGYDFQTAKIESRGTYYRYFGGSKGQVILGRFSSIQEIDPAIAETDAGEPMGSAMFLDSFRELLPTFIDPDKPKINNSFLILERQGLTTAVHGQYPSLPMAGEIYSLFGMDGVLYIPFFVFFAYLLVLKKVGWGLYGNAFSIFVLCSAVMSHGHDGALANFLGTIFRGVPVIILLVWTLMKSYHFLTQRHFRFTE